MGTSHIYLHVKSYTLTALNSLSDSQDSPSLHDSKDISKSKVVCLALSRPHKANALTRDMVEQATAMLEALASDVRIFVIYGEGSHFCSGVDLQWLNSSVGASYKQQKKEGEIFQRFLLALYHLSCPTIAVVHGSCAGGGLGIISVCDSVIVAESARLFLGEVHVGLLPATILPYLAKKIPHGHLQRYALSGQAIALKDALAYGLCHRTFLHQPEVILSKEISCYLEGSCQVQSRLKDLFRKGVKGADYSGSAEFARMLSEEDAALGLQSFCEKTASPWALKLHELIKLPF
ncbi:MAG: enoyl-CoA hydratase-related protein [Proteobacteria bacterium]|nr:enoyl-CoA hydratase-related protein [Pseudomonadota bacterium]